MIKIIANRNIKKKQNYVIWIQAVTGLMEDELGGKIMKEFVGLRAKTYSYLIDNGSEDKKAKGTKKCVVKRLIQRS